MKQILETLKQQGNFRELRSIEVSGKYISFQDREYINLSSNDYLGIAGSGMQREFLENIDFNSSFLLGTPSSRLLTGNVEAYTKLEDKLADIFSKERALVLGSGFLLNSGALPALTQKGDLIIADKLVHASIIEGLKLCECKWTRFLHNDVESLERILQRERESYRRVIVVTESIFSMDGDIAPLQEIVNLKKKYNFEIYLDEAHAFGVRGTDGYGVANQMGLISEIDYVVATFGKAIASQGAFIACNNFSCEVLINRMRTLIFSTALPEISLKWTLHVIEQLPNLAKEREILSNLSTELSTLLCRDVDNPTHIQPYILGSNNLAVEYSIRLREAGFWVSAIKHPTVALGSERLRFSLTANLSSDDIRGMIDILKNL